MEQDQKPQEKTGLTFDEAKKKLSELGPNQIFTPKEISFFSIAKEEIIEAPDREAGAVTMFFTNHDRSALQTTTCPLPTLERRRPAGSTRRSCEAWHPAVKRGGMRHACRAGIALAPRLLRPGLPAEFSVTAMQTKIARNTGTLAGALRLRRRPQPPSSRMR